MKLIDYIKGDRRGREAHRTELDAMSDPFLSEAIEGFDAVDGDHDQTISRLRDRVDACSAGRSRPARRRTFVLSAAAVAVLCLAIGGLYFVLQNENQPSPMMGSVYDSLKNKDTNAVIALDSRREQLSAEIQEVPAVERNLQAQVHQDASVPQRSAGEPSLNLKDIHVEKSVVDYRMQMDENMVEADAAIIADDIMNDSSARESEALAEESVIPSAISASKVSYAQKRKSSKSESLQASDLESSQASALEFSENTAPQYDADEKVRFDRVTRNKEREQSVIPVVISNGEIEKIIEEFNKYVVKNIIPQTDKGGNKVTGKVVVQFETDGQGRPVNIKIIDGLKQDANREARRLVKGYKKWPSDSDKIEVLVEFK